MSTTTLKDDKPSILDELKKQEAEIAAKIKEATSSILEELHKKLAAAHEQVQSITKEIERHSGNSAPKRRGRKTNKFKLNGATPKTKRATKGKRGSVGEAITAFVTSKGKTGAHVKDISKETGNKPANVTAFFYAKANKGKFKKVAPATFALHK